MPGIVGLVTKMPPEYARGELVRMVNALRHDDSYATGIWLDERLGVYVGWAVRKNSFSEGMPLRNERGDVVLVFSGEEYPEPGTASRLKQQGHELELDAASYLVHLYEEHPDFPAGLNGRFHGFLTDRTRETSILFNDRYGLQRIYYHEAKDGFYFAAEAKAILAVRPELRASDPRGLGELVSCGCVLENRTLFKDIFLLPPASLWHFRNGSIQQKSSYFQPQDWENQSPLDEETYYQELREVFSRTLPRYFNGSERVGMSLTGGLDGRMVMASHNAAPGSLPCYSFGGMFRECEDVKLARQVAHACGQSYEVIPVGKEFFSKFSHYAQRTVYLTDGCTNVGHSPDLYANERAAKIAPVRMTGNYGSEVLRGSRAFKPVQPPARLFADDFLGYVETAEATYKSLLGGHPVSFATFRQAPWHHYGLLALEQTQVALRSPYLDNDLVRTVFRAPLSSLKDANISLRLIADGNKSLLRIRTDRGLAGEHRGLAAVASRKFLDFTTKAEYAYDYGMPQWLARVDHVLSPLHLERVFLGRQKFSHFRVWYRDQFADYVREMLLDPRSLSRPYLQRKTLETMVQDHTEGKCNYTLAIHKVLTLELIHRLFLDSHPVDSFVRDGADELSGPGQTAATVNALATPRN